MTLVLLHGFAGSPASWDDVVALLPPSLDILRPTLAGHDGTPPPASWEDEVARLAALVPDGAHLCGYSLGARLALGILARHPHRSRRATLASAHPGLLAPADRAARADDDERWARRLEAGGLAHFSAAWDAHPLFAGLPAAARAARTAGRARHDARSLAASMRALSLARMPAHPPDASDTPLTLLVGAHDTKFRALAARLPHATVEVVAHAGHDLLHENPAAVAAAICREDASC